MYMYSVLLLLSIVFIECEMRASLVRRFFRVARSFRRFVRVCVFGCFVCELLFMLL